MPRRFADLRVGLVAAGAGSVDDTRPPGRRSTLTVHADLPEPVSTHVHPFQTQASCIPPH